MTLLSGSNFATGTLADANPLVVSAADLRIPATVALNSAAGGRLIEYSVDDGTVWQAAVIDVTSANQIIAKIQAPIAALRFTGVNGNKYFIR